VLRIAGPAGGAAPRFLALQAARVGVEIVELAVGRRPGRLRASAAQRPAARRLTAALPARAVLRLVRARALRLTLALTIAAALRLARALAATAVLGLVRATLALALLALLTLALLALLTLALLALLTLALLTLALLTLALLALLTLALLTLALLTLLTLTLLTLALLALLALLTLALLALLTLALLALALLALLGLLALLLALLLLPPAQRELEVEPRVVELGLLAQRLLVGLDRVVELVLAQQQVAAVEVRTASDPRVPGVRRLLEILERALGQPLLLGRVPGRLRLPELGGPAVEREAVVIDRAAPPRALVRRERVVVAALGVGPVAGLDVGIGAAKRLPAAEREDEHDRERAPHPASMPRPGHAASG
jgi:hypothetical protein